ncbi:MAG: hypothetical protein V1818_01825 [Candidatus Aenigmatarchaeota archaeon]
MEFIDRKTIKLDKVPTLLDKFVVDFVKVLEKHAGYVIVSGYVSILFGRSRATEDIDILIEKMNADEFKSLYSDLKDNGYWCLEAESVDGIMGALLGGLAVRFAKKPNVIPNMELKFVKNPVEKKAVATAIGVVMKTGKIRISSIELQIAYKEKVLKSEKDMEDARHLETVFKSNIDHKLLGKYREMLE